MIRKLLILFILSIPVFSAWNIGSIQNGSGWDIGAIQTSDVPLSTGTDSGSTIGGDTVVIYGDKLDSLNNVLVGDSGWSILSRTVDSAITISKPYPDSGTFDIIVVHDNASRDTLSDGWRYFPGTYTSEIAINSTIPELSIISTYISYSTCTIAVEATVPELLGIMTFQDSSYTENPHRIDDDRSYININVGIGL